MLVKIYNWLIKLEEFFGIGKTRACCGFSLMASALARIFYFDQQLHYP